MVTPHCRATVLKKRRMNKNTNPLKKTTHSVPENFKKNNIQNTFHSANYLFNELTKLVIPQINQI